MSIDNSFLVGVSFLGSKFVQDSNPSWIKIDNVALGEHYGYRSVVNPDIGKLLNSLSNDPMAQVIVYHWASGTAYLKYGFYLPLVSDSKVNTEYTTFILKSTLPTPTIISNPSPVSDSSFVSWDGRNFMCNGKKFVPVGINAYWLGLMEGQVYPALNQITEVFKGAQKCSFTMIRAHTLGVSTGNGNSLRPNSNNLNNNAWRTIDFAISEAKKYGIKLCIPLIDEYNYYHGNYGHFTETRGVSKDKFWTDINVRNDFKDYITKYLNHTNQFTGVKIKDSPEIAFIETGNEIGQNKARGEWGGLPTQDWITDITKFIKNIAPKIMVMDGCDESLGKANNFAVKETDCFSAHFYWLDKNRITYGASNAKNVGKPYIIGECSTKFDNSWFNFIENVDNVCGSLAWSLYPHDNGQPNGYRIPHGEPDYTQTVYFDNQSTDNTDYMIRITNHCRRMQGLPQISSLTF